MNDYKGNGIYGQDAAPDQVLHCLLTEYSIKIEKKMETTTHQPFKQKWTGQRTSDGGNGNHIVLLPTILMKNKVDLKFPSSYISLLLVYIF